MEAYFIDKNDENKEETNSGRLNISVTNLPEFERLITQANKEAEQLKETINKMKRFYIEIDFNINKKSIFSDE